MLGATNHAEVVAGGGQVTFGMVLSHTLKTEVRLLGTGFTADCHAVVAKELQAEFIYEHVEHVKAVAGTGMGSVGIHDYVGIVTRKNCAKLCEKAGSSLTCCSQPQTVARSTVRACPQHACSECTLSLGHGSCSGSGWACCPSRRWHTDVRAGMFSQPLAKFLGVVFAAWHDGAHGQDSQFILQQVEESDGVVKVVHEQHVVLVGDLRVLHETADNTAG